MTQAQDQPSIQCSHLETRGRHQCRPTCSSWKAPLQRLPLHAETHRYQKSNTQGSSAPARHPGTRPWRQRHGSQQKRAVTGRQDRSGALPATTDSQRSEDDYYASRGSVSAHARRTCNKATCAPLASLAGLARSPPHLRARHGSPACAPRPTCMRAMPRSHLTASSCACA